MSAGCGVCMGGAKEKKPSRISYVSRVRASHRMPSKPAPAEDPREKELREVTTRIKELHDLLKNGHTPATVKAAIADAESRLGDQDKVYIHADSKSFVGTVHIQSLMNLSDALDLRVKMGARHPLKEFERLLERRIELIRELHRIGATPG